MAEEASFTAKLIDQVSRNAKAIRSAMSGVETSMTRTARAAKRGGVDRSIGSMARLSDAAGSSLDVMGSVGGAAFMALKTGAIAGAVAIGAAAVGLATLTVRAAMFGQESKLAIGNLVHGGEDAGKVFKDVTGLAASLGLDVKSTTKDFQKLLAAQFSIGASKEIIKMGADLQGIGVDAEGVSSVFRSMTQIKSKGRLQGEEMLQLQEAGVSAELVFNALGKRLGKTNAAVQKLMSAGKIDSALGLEAIGEAIKVKTGVSQFGELGKKFADTTIAGMAGKLKGGFDIMFTEAGAKVIPVLEKTLGPIAKEVMGFFEGEGGSSFIDGIVAAFETVGSVIETIIPIGKMFFSGLSGPIGDLMFGMKGVGGGFKEAFANPAFLESVKSIGIFVGKLAVGAIGLAAGLLRLVPVIASVTAFMAKWFNTAMLIVNLPAVLLAASTAMVGMALKIGIDFVKGLSNGIGGAASIVIQSVKNLGSTVVSAIRAVLGMGSPSKVMAKQGMFTAQGFAQGITAGIPLINNAANDFALTGAEASFARAGATMGTTSNSASNSVGSIQIMVQAPPGADPQKFGEAIGESLRGQFESMFASISPASAA